ncbi:hypothetical protein LAUMK191_05662 [Mycobacterium attenuatum]|uniref:Uncharacterized protein n=1 Tax=Mycobacterium attenuatum TaxID=2341086 RepID=A0A498PVG9_9MYCO|nr:hypothetical protein LAUMK136_02099 [Mycobacterium attenuatum]VBA60742.1 hypothetical protein LAUMK191_05662 [Mycobacterium attenuatum]VBA62479.1 hypothetical protein LAUMK41_05870 [Mycobacterium attenuatum]
MSFEMMRYLSPASLHHVDIAVTVIDSYLRRLVSRARSSFT